MMTLNVENNSWTLLGQILQWVAVMGDCQAMEVNLCVKENVKALCTLWHEEI